MATRTHRCALYLERQQVSYSSATAECPRNRRINDDSSRVLAYPTKESGFVATELATEFSFSTNGTAGRGAGGVGSADPAKDLDAKADSEFSA